MSASLVSARDSRHSPSRKGAGGTQGFPVPFISRPQHPQQPLGNGIGRYSEVPRSDPNFPAHHRRPTPQTSHPMDDPVHYQDMPAGSSPRGASMAPIAPDYHQQSLLAALSNPPNPSAESHIEISLCSLADDCVIPWIPHIEMSALHFPSSLLRPLLICLAHPSPTSHLLLDLTQANTAFSSAPTTLPHNASPAALLAAGVPPSFVDFRRWATALMLAHAGLAHCFVSQKKTQESSQIASPNSNPGIRAAVSDPENPSFRRARSTHPARSRPDTWNRDTHAHTYSEHSTGNPSVQDSSIYPRSHFPQSSSPHASPPSALARARSRSPRDVRTPTVAQAQARVTFAPHPTHEAPSVHGDGTGRAPGNGTGAVRGDMEADKRRHGRDGVLRGAGEGAGGMESEGSHARVHAFSTVSVAARAARVESNNTTSDLSVARIPLNHSIFPPYFLPAPHLRAHMYPVACFPAGPQVHQHLMLQWPRNPHSSQHQHTHAHSRSHDGQHQHAYADAHVSMPSISSLAAVTTPVPVPVPASLLALPGAPRPLADRWAQDATGDGPLLASLAQTQAVATHSFYAPLPPVHAKTLLAASLRLARPEVVPLVQENLNISQNTRPPGQGLRYPPRLSLAQAVLPRESCHPCFSQPIVSQLSLPRIRMNLLAHAIRLLTGLSVCVVMGSPAVSPLALITHTEHADFYPVLNVPGQSHFSHFLNPGRPVHTCGKGAALAALLRAHADEDNAHNTASNAVSGGGVNGASVAGRATERDPAAAVGYCLGCASSLAPAAPLPPRAASSPIAHHVLLVHDIDALPADTQAVLATLALRGTGTVAGVDVTAATGFRVIGVRVGGSPPEDTAITVDNSHDAPGGAGDVSVACTRINVSMVPRTHSATRHMGTGMSVVRGLEPQLRAAFLFSHTPSAAFFPQLDAFVSSFAHCCTPPVLVPVMTAPLRGGQWASVPAPPLSSAAAYMARAGGLRGREPLRGDALKTTGAVTGELPERGKEKERDGGKGDGVSSPQLSLHEMAAIKKELETELGLRQYVIGCAMSVLESFAEELDATHPSVKEDIVVERNDTLPSIQTVAIVDPRMEHRSLAERLALLEVVDKFTLEHRRQVPPLLPNVVDVLRASVANAHAEDSLRLLILDTVSALRNHPCVWQGPPVAHHAHLLAAAQMLAVLRGRAFATEEDVRLVLLEGLPHHLTVRVQGQDGFALADARTDAGVLPRLGGGRAGAGVGVANGGRGGTGGPVMAGQVAPSYHTICPACGGMQQRGGSDHHSLGNGSGGGGDGVGLGVYGVRGSARAHPLRAGHAGSGRRGSTDEDNAGRFRNHVNSHTRGDVDFRRTPLKGILAHSERDDHSWMAVGTGTGAEGVRGLEQYVLVCECKGARARARENNSFQDIFYTFPTYWEEISELPGKTSSQYLFSRSPLESGARVAAPAVRTPALAVATVSGASDRGRWPGTSTSMGTGTGTRVGANIGRGDVAYVPLSDSLPAYGIDAAVASPLEYGYGVDDGVADAAASDMSASRASLRYRTYDSTAVRVAGERASAWMRIVDSDEDSSEDEDDEGEWDYGHGYGQGAARGVRLPGATITVAPSAPLVLSVPTPMQRVLVAGAAIGGDDGIADIDAMLRGYQSVRLDITQQIQRVMESTLFAISLSRDEFVRHVLQSQVQLLEESMRSCSALSSHELQQIYDVEGLHRIRPGEDPIDPYFIFRTRKHLWWRESVARAVVTYIVDHALVGPLYAPF